MNTPAPTSRAVATPLGPAAPSRKGTSTGRAGPNPDGWSMRISPPSHGTVSPRSSALTVVTYRATSAHRNGRWPIA